MRISYAVVLVALVICFTFFLFKLPTIMFGVSPISPYLMHLRHILSPCLHRIHPSEEMLNYLFTQYGLVPDPDVFGWIYMFGRFVGNSFSGKFGISLLTEEPVSAGLMERIPNTLLLMISSIVISTIYLRIKSDRNNGNRYYGRKTLTLKNYFSSSTPVFWIAMLILLFGGSLIPEWVGLGFPQFGTFSNDVWEFAQSSAIGFYLVVIDVIYHLALPAATLILFTISSNNSLASMFSKSILISEEDSNGKSRNFGAAHFPTNREIMTAVVNLFCATFLVEITFKWRGIGIWFFESFFYIDVPVLEACFIVFSLLVIGITLVSDITLSYMNQKQNNSKNFDITPVTQKLAKSRTRVF